MNCAPKVRQKTFGVLIMKYSYEQQLVIVQRVKQEEAMPPVPLSVHPMKCTGALAGYYMSVNSTAHTEIVLLSGYLWT